VSALKDAIGAVKEALRLADEVKRLAESLKGLSVEVRDHERRVTRLEAKWETAIEMAQISGGRRAPPKRTGEGQG
jgi:hypothetical protein